MKKIKLITLSLLVVLISITACKDEFLDVAPQGSLGTTELSSLAGVEGELIGAYSILLGRSGAVGFGDPFYDDVSNWFWGSVLGGEANKGTDPGDQSQVNEIQSYAAQTNNASVLSKYRTAYEGIARCNATLKILGESEVIGDADKARISGEARFLRALYYFELKKNFNNTPYVDETWDEISEVSNKDDLWPFIEADLVFAKDNLPAMQSDVGRANSWAASALLGRAYLFQGKYDDAKTILTQVIESGMNNNGQPYDLVPNYADVFRSTNDNNEESIFSVQAAAGTGNIANANPGMVLNFPNGPVGPGCCGFFQPSFDLVNSFRTDANGLPLLDNSYNDGGNALVNDMGVGAEDAFTPDGGNLDPRLDHSVGRRGIPYLDWGPHPGVTWIRNQPYGGPYSPKKFIYYLEGNGTENDVSSWTPGYTAVNYNVIRFADVLLMAAEAEIESSGGSLDKAAEYIDRLRTRAANSPVLDGGSPAANYVISNYGSFGSQSEARTALRFERKLELSGEGHRKYDLVRWGIAAETLNAYLANEDPLLNAPFVGASFTANQDEYLPIPQNEIDLLGPDVLIQNPGY